MPRQKKTPESWNQRHASYARDALNTYCLRAYGEPVHKQSTGKLHEALADLLTDLHHFAHIRGIPMQPRIDAAWRRCAQEIADPDLNMPE